MSKELEDRLAVQDVMLHYASTVDEKNYAGYKALFAEDVVVVGMGGEDMHGIEEYYPWWKEALDKYANTQHMLSPTFAIIEEDMAYTRTDVQALHFFPGDSETTMIFWGTYKTDMRRIDGVWKISRHELIARGLKQS
ncbi:MAG: hypothetical protein CMQ40_03145 [Gammaproteobacteria bacterium]|nr:hypothetical protein [Gammaproteobacteria bacterium]|tara:strand:+ start:133 stop:543 length:411 start_codon:yes stop_codon:yes gene_type:complete